MRAPKYRGNSEVVVTARRELAIDFSNALAWRGSNPQESLRDLDSLFAWLAAANVLSTRAAAPLRRWFADHPQSGAGAFVEAIEIREAIYAILHALALGNDPAPSDLSRLNLALASAPARTRLDRGGDAIGWKIEIGPNALAMLAPIIWSAADIIAGADRARVRECANHRCLWLFLDQSKNGTRRWCSMQACGNRAKAQRHYTRTRSESRRKARVKME